MTVPSFPHMSCLFDGSPCGQEAKSKCEAPGDRYDGQIRLARDLAPLLEDIPNSKERSHGRQCPDPRSVTGKERTGLAGYDRTSHAGGPVEGYEILQHFSGAKDNAMDDDRCVGRARKAQALARPPYITTRFFGSHPRARLTCGTVLPHGA